MRYLLDTNILSNLVRRPQGPIAEHVAHVGEEKIGTSIIVAAELRFGAEKRGSAQLKERVAAILDVVNILPFGPPADLAYGRLRANLERKGRVIGANDLLIASHALSENLILVTDNVREFGRIEDLTCENWLRDT